MTKNSKVLMIIPARGGSKRLPRKNVLPLSGKPLVCWTIESALRTGIDARVMVTSDDDEILRIADGYRSRGVIAHRRSEELASDTATTVDTIIDAVRAESEAGHKHNTIVLLQPTSPLRNALDILAALKVFQDGNRKDTVVSVCEVEHPTAWVGVIRDNSDLVGIDLSMKRSQDYQKEYRLNGAIYIFDADILMKSGSLFTERLRASVMPRKRSFDIDEELDFKLCESVVERG